MTAVLSQQQKELQKIEDEMELDMIELMKRASLNFNGLLKTNDDLKRMNDELCMENALLQMEIMELKSEKNMIHNAALKLENSGLKKEIEEWKVEMTGLWNVIRKHTPTVYQRLKNNAHK